MGEFNATDTDPGAILTYSLAAGAGDGNNSLFTLEANGTLKSAALLDYEAGATLSIRVQVQDENNASIQQSFSISVADIVLEDWNKIIAPDKAASDYFGTPFPSPAIFSP